MISQRDQGVEPDVDGDIFGKAGTLSASAVIIRYVSSPLLHLHRAIDVHILVDATAAHNHSLRCLLLVLSREILEIFYLALERS